MALYENAENVKLAYKAANVRETLRKVVVFLNKVFESKDSFLQLWKSYEYFATFEDVTEEFYVEVDKLSYLAYKASEEMEESGMDDMRYAVYITDLAKEWVSLGELVADTQDMLEGCLMTYMSSTRGKDKEMSAEEFDNAVRNDAKWKETVDNLYNKGLEAIGILRDGVENIPEIMESSEIAWDEFELE